MVCARSSKPSWIPCAPSSGPEPIKLHRTRRSSKRVYRLSRQSYTGTSCPAPRSSRECSSMHPKAGNRVPPRNFPRTGLRSSSPWTFSTCSSMYVGRCVCVCVLYHLETYILGSPQCTPRYVNMYDFNPLPPPPTLRKQLLAVSANNEDWSHRVTQCLIQLAGIHGPIFNNDGVKKAYAAHFIKHVLHNLKA